MMRFLHCDRGAATVEAAIVVPVLLSLGLGAAETGNLVNEVHGMKAGLAAGARVLARAPTPESIETTALNLAVTGAADGAGHARVAGWKVEQVDVSYRWVDNSAGLYTGGAQVRIVRLTTSKPYKGLRLLTLAGDFNLTATHEERWTGGGG
jgi:Flp pilus assembly protein TadG